MIISVRPLSLARQGALNWTRSRFVSSASKHQRGVQRMLPDYTVKTQHSVVVKAPIGTVYDTFRTLDFSSSRAIRILFTLARMPFRRLTIPCMLKNGFSLLNEEPNHEFVFGEMGSLQFPFPTQCKIKDADHFFSFRTPQSYKIACGFYFDEISPNTTNVSTETRVLCNGSLTQTAFSVYWLFVNPFSSLVRNEMLRIGKYQSEC